MISYEKFFIVLEQKNIKRTHLVYEGIISSETMMRLRTNQNLSMYTIEQLSDYLQCDITDIFTVEWFLSFLRLLSDYIPHF